MVKGLDVAEDSTEQVDCLTANGFTFICRYYNKNNPSKNLTLAEARSLSTAGLEIVAIWENGFPTKASYFSRQKGLSDAKAALEFAVNVIGQPEGSAIYFAVDYDASPADVSGRITRYFEGVKTVFDAAGSKYKTGVYGSGAVSRSLLSADLVSFSWLSQSTGFRGSKTFKDFNIKQGPETTICGMDADSDDAPDIANIGAFTV